MTVFNSDEKQYLVSILKKDSGSKYMQYINSFINDFIAKFIYNKLFNIDNNEMDVREKIDLFYENKEEFIVNKDSVKEIFFDAFPETIGRQSSCNIIEIINRNYIKFGNDKLMMYLSIRKIFIELFYSKHLFFNLDNKKYIQIIEYKFFNFNYTDFSKLKEFCHQLIIEIINIYIFSDKQAINCTDEEKTRFSQYKNKAIGLFDMYMSEDIINGYKNKFPFNKNIYIEKIYNDIYQRWVNNINNDTNKHTSLKENNCKTQNKHQDIYEKICNNLKDYISHGSAEKYKAIIESNNFGNNRKKYIKLQDKYDTVINLKRFAHVFQLELSDMKNIFRGEVVKTLNSVYLKENEKKTPFYDTLISTRNSYLYEINQEKYPKIE